jgi:membrane protease YdiL (CAAX protease family)
MQGTLKVTSAPNEAKPLHWCSLARVVLFFLSSAMLLAAGSPLTKKIPGTSGNLVLGLIVALGTFALTVLFVRWEGTSLQNVGAAWARGSYLRFASGFLAGLVLVALYASISAFSGHVRWVRSPQNGFVSAMVSLATFLALSCREELGFRGYPLRRLYEILGLWSAQIIVALVFAAEHVAGGWPLSRAVLGAGVGSLMFGMAAIATKGLAVPIGMHAAWNFGDWILGGKGAPGFWQVVVEQGHEERARLVGTIGYITIMILATVTLWMWHRSSKPHPEAYEPHVR